MEDDDTLGAIAKQSDWYGKNARKNRTIYVSLKTIQLVMAAMIPLVSLADVPELSRWSTAILGALIGAIEGFLQLGQYQQNWHSYRSTREALKSEEMLFRGEAGPYADPTNKRQLFIERSCAVISREHSSWVATQRETLKEVRG